MIEVMLLTLVGAAMIAGGAYDATKLTIPNWISLVLLGLFPLLAYSAGLSFGEAGIHAAVGFGALVIGAGLFAVGVVGGGDAKLLAAVSLYIGAAWVGTFLFTVALVGGVIGCVMLVVRWTARGPIGRRLAWLKNLTNVGADIPYGIAIAAGGLFVFPATHLFALAAAGQ